MHWQSSSPNSRRHGAGVGARAADDAVRSAEPQVARRGDRVERDLADVVGAGAEVERRQPVEADRIEVEAERVEVAELLGEHALVPGRELRRAVVGERVRLGLLGVQSSGTTVMTISVQPSERAASSVPLPAMTMVCAAGAPADQRPALAELSQAPGDRLEVARAVLARVRGVEHERAHRHGLKGQRHQRTSGK